MSYQTNPFLENKTIHLILPLVLEYGVQAGELVLNITIGSK